MEPEEVGSDLGEPIGQWSAVGSRRDPEHRSPGLVQALPGEAARPIDGLEHLAPVSTGPEGILVSGMTPEVLDRGIPALAQGLCQILVAIRGSGRATSTVPWYQRWTSSWGRR